jgi:hypothetical protein
VRRLEDAVGAGAEQEGALQRIDRAANGTGRSEGAEIIALAARAPRCFRCAGATVVAGDEDIGKRLVVAQQHVEARPQALDQIGFEQQRFDLGARRDELHVRRLAHHLGDAIGVDAAMRIVGDALLQAARLADIEHVAGFVEHAVDAGAVRQPLDEFGRSVRRRSSPVSLSPPSFQSTTAEIGAAEASLSTSISSSFSSVSS